MKISKMLMTIGLMAALVFSGAVSAHDYSGILGKASTATDKWYFQCLNPRTVKVTFQVARTAGVGCVKATYAASGANARACTSTFAPTTPINVATGAGAKFFTINKNPATSGFRRYRVKAHCIENTGLKNPADQTDVQVYQQNQ